MARHRPRRGRRFRSKARHAREPAFGLPAKWIAEVERYNRAEMAGYTVVDAPNVIITHLGEVVRRHAGELLSRDDLKAMVDKVRETSPAVVDDLIPTVLPMGMLHRVLTTLLPESGCRSRTCRASWRAWRRTARPRRTMGELAERVRVDIGRAVIDRFRDAGGRIRAIVLDPRLEVEFRRLVQNSQLACSTRAGWSN